MKTPTSHTPGPWFVKQYSGSDYWFVSQQRQQETDGIAQVYRFVEEGDGRANALLVAAAPELLEWFEAAVDVVEGQIESGEPSLFDVTEARALIARVKGEPQGDPDGQTP